MGDPMFAAWGLPLARRNELMNPSTEAENEPPKAADLADRDGNSEF
jgi:hypothetical protein